MWLIHSPLKFRNQIWFGFSLFTIACSTCAGQGNQSPLTLPSDLPIVMQYHVVEHDVRPVAMRNFLSDYVIRLPGHHNSNDLKSVKPDVSYNMTVSASNGKLLVTRSYPDHQDTMLYDGAETLERIENNPNKDSSSQQEASSCLIHKGPGWMYRSLVPLPGVGLADMPLVRASESARVGLHSSNFLPGLSPTFERGTTEDVSYLPSSSNITSDQGKLKVIKCVLQDADNKIDQQWEFKNHISFAKYWVAQNITFTDYQSYWIGSQNMRDPSDRFDITLRAIRIKAIPANQFLITHWVHNGDHVSDFTDNDKTAYFFYSNYGGPLENQVSEARRYQAKPSGPNLFHSSPLGGVFVLLILGVSAAAIAVHRFRQRQP